MCIRMSAEEKSDLTSSGDKGRESHRIFRNHREIVMIIRDLRSSRTLVVSSYRCESSASQPQLPGNKKEQLSC
jgi:hypothetical protein